MNTMHWVLFDRTEGAKTGDGEKLTPTAMKHMADAVQAQINEEFAAEWGAQAYVRVGVSATDIKAGEWAYIFVESLPDAPGASAYHDIDKKGVPYALCAVTTCGSLLGQNGVSVDVSHEILETFGDEGANLYAYDNVGLLHALEMCDAVELQTYTKPAKDGTAVEVSNWLLRTWFMPGAKGPYDFMTSAKKPGAVAPTAPFKTAAGHGGNYQIVGKWGGATHDVYAAHASRAAEHIMGFRQKGMNPHWSSRTAFRLAQMARKELRTDTLPADMRGFGINRVPRAPEA